MPDESSSQLGDQFAAKALEQFNQRKNGDALNLLVKAGVLSTSNPDALALLLSLAVSLPNPAEIVDMVAQSLAERDFPAEARLALTSDLIQTARECNVAIDERLLTAMVLEGVAGSNDDLWASLSFDWWSRLEVLMQRDDMSLRLLEQLFYAPDSTGLPALALQFAETSVAEAPGDRQFSRAMKRLLHAVGQREAAYQIERTRRTRSQDLSLELIASPEPRLDEQVIVIAGGHSGLRAVIKRMVGSLGGQTVDIPARFEAVRRDRDVSGAVRFANVAVLITSQISHSTSDQVRSAAYRHNVPILSARSGSAHTILRMLIDRTMIKGPDTPSERDGRQDE
ncbi:hypothetical protein BH23CHL5_BH23CHL5_05640 [soil metagenome]